MAKSRTSFKQLQINKANATVLIFVGVAAFLTTFSLIASKSLLDKRAYQSKVISENKAALNQLKANEEAVEKLFASYSEFEGRSENIIGGQANGSGDRDGKNSRIILDSLPSSYDFPALATSLEKLLSDPNYEIKGIVGKDDEVSQRGSESISPVEIPFEMEVVGKYEPVQTLLVSLEKSIRPFKATSVKLTAQENNDMLFTYKGITYFLPEKRLKNETKEVQP